MTDERQNPKPLVLVVDDEPQIRRLLTFTLEGGGLRVLAVEKGHDALIQAAQYRPALILLDLGLPDIKGLDVLKQLREWTNVPVIVLTAIDTETDKVAALDGGADDYVTKPFNAAELMARIRVALRHSQKDSEPPVFHSGSLVVDLSSRRVTLGGKDVSLTATEYSLLRFFVRHAGKVLTHRQILREVWGPNSETQTHYLRVYLARLREKLESDPAQPEFFLTEPGVGYRFAEKAKG
ncbi:MAG TPA: response regulator [Candidatus Limnocylindria bacterium]|jgi:two-component system KDP operon response regulator KdpE|nr:response regulator [Candidatus Limnocylindria bacterium]